MRLLREHNSDCRSEMRTRSSCSCKINTCNVNTQKIRTANYLLDEFTIWVKHTHTQTKKTDDPITLTCWWLCSMAFSSSRLAELFSLRWICFKCSMAVAWRWLSSARREAARQRHSVKRRKYGVQFFVEQHHGTMVGVIMDFVYKWDH